MNRDTCKNCGEPVVLLIAKERGRPMPCNPETITVHFIRREQGTEADREAIWRQITILTPDRVILRGFQLPSPRPGSEKIVGRVSHYSTCKKAGYFRDRAAQKRAGGSVL